MVFETKFTALSMLRWTDARGNADII